MTEKYIQWKLPQRKAEVAVLISDKVDLEQRKLPRTERDIK